MTSSLAESLAGGSPLAWAEDLLAGLQCVPTFNNLQAIYSWEFAESGGGGGMWNPLNTTEPWPGSTTINADGVRNYASRADGLAATVAVLGLNFYGQIIGSLERGTSALATKFFIEASPWGTQHITLLPLPAVPPAPPVGEDTMQIVASPHRPSLPGRTPAAIWDPTNPNVVILTNGASIAGDEAFGDVRVWTPPLPPGATGVGIGATVHTSGLSKGQPDGNGIFLQDSLHDTYIGEWS